MSASLVGSEMCIRDRSQGCPGVTPVVNRLGRSIDRLIRSTDRLSDRPVSYTHLTLPTICSV
eukprot:3938761-Alexandrium_andersonii.AAC.1